MARTRALKPSFFTNEDLSDCEPLARLLFAGLWCYADREGYLEERPKKLKIEILPWDNCDVESLLSQLEQHNFIIRYTAEGMKCIFIPTFAKHQRPHPSEPRSDIPDLSEKNIASNDLAVKNSGLAVKNSDESCTSREKKLQVVPLHDLPSHDLPSHDLPETMKKHENDLEEPSELPTADMKDIYDELKRCSFVKLNDAFIESLLKEFTSSEIVAELKKADRWAVANPRKAKKNWQQFFNNWMGNYSERKKLVPIKPVDKPQDPPRELTDEEKYDHLPECHRPAWYNQKKTREREEQYWKEEQERRERQERKHA